jgi:hypothetical protein
MRAYRTGERERTARLVDPDEAPEALIENRKLRERVVQLEDERDRPWAQIIRLQGELRANSTDHRTPGIRVDGELPGSTLPSSGALPSRCQFRLQLALSLPAHPPTCCDDGH